MDRAMRRDSLSPVGRGLEEGAQACRMCPGPDFIFCLCPLILTFSPLGRRNTPLMVSEAEP